MHYSSNATRWEKAVVGANSIVAEVTKFDPDGVDIVMVGGGVAATTTTTLFEDEEETEESATADEEDEACVEWHRNVQTAEGLEELVTEKEPKGSCPLGKAMNEVLTEALSKDLKKCPCSILVMTAGKPTDPDLLEQSLQNATQQVADSGGIKISPLSVTFIQIGKDPDATEYLEYLDKKMTARSISDSEDSKKKPVDIVDTMTFADIKDTMDAMREAEKDARKKSNSNGKTGAIVGGLAGAAIGVGGMYLASKNKSKKRIASGSWDGKWKCYYDDEEIATLNVTDDRKGNITIDGLVETMTGTYGPSNDEEEGEFFIQFTDPTGEVVTGEFDEKLFVLTWSDGTRWEACNKTSALKYVGAAAAGAAVLGGTGYVIDKKFFNKMKAKDQCDYILVVDRSVHMIQRDKK